MKQSAVVTKPSASELAGPGSTSHAALVDVDGDGDLDVRSAANGYLLLWNVHDISGKIYTVAVGFGRKSE